MSHHQRKSVRAPRNATFVNNFSSTNRDNADIHLPESISTSFYGRKRDQLVFKQGADPVFKVLYSVVILQSRRDCIIDEQVDNIYRAERILCEAKDLRARSPGCFTRGDYIELLESTLDDYRTSVVLRAGVRAKLSELQSMQFEPLDVSSLEEWFNDYNAFLTHLKELNNDWSTPDELNHAAEIIQENYTKYLQLQKENHVRTEPQLTDSHEYCVSGNVSQLDRVLIAMCREDASTNESAWHKFEAIFHIYEILGDMMQGNELNQPTGFTIDNLAGTLHLLSKELICVLGRFGSIDSVTRRHVALLTEITVLCQGFCHALGVMSASAIDNRLSAMLSALTDSVDGNPERSLEHDFASLARLVSIIAMDVPISIDSDEWDKFAPRMLWYGGSSAFNEALQNMYTVYKSKAYTEEKKKFWLAIWEGLKTTYLLIRNQNMDLQMLDTSLASDYFKRKSIQNQFELIMSGPEPLYTEIIENVVAEYCIHIAENTKISEFRKDASEANSVFEAALQTVYDYIKTSKFSDFVADSIDACATKLILSYGSPVYVRRLNKRSTSNSRSLTSEWDYESVDVESALVHVSERNEFVQRVSSRKTSPRPSILVQREPVKATTTNPLDWVARSSDKRASSRENENYDIDFRLDHIDIVSGFDYVYYPFPETRALEVAQSRQIDRELNSSGVYSRGTHEEDVINRPPRHAWPPGTISIWTKPLAIDPFNVMRALWSRWRNGRPKIRSLRQPRPHPAITPRRPRQDWADEHPRVRPLLDMKNRISKPADRRQSRFRGQNTVRFAPLTHVPTLRGGGRASIKKNAPRSLPDAPNPPSDITIPQRRHSMHEINHFTQKLVSRLRGYWRGGDVPPTHLIQRYFLIPCNWNVDAAHIAVRHFVDSGLLDGMRFYYDDNQERNSADSSDPFCVFGVIPGEGVDLMNYGLPHQCSKVLSGAPGYSTSAQSLGTIPSRRYKDLVSILPGHLKGFPHVGHDLKAFDHEDTPQPRSRRGSSAPGSQQPEPSTTMATSPAPIQAQSKGSVKPCEIRKREKYTFVGNKVSRRSIATGTKIAGYNLRNRTTLANRRQARLQVLGVEIPVAADNGGSDCESGSVFGEELANQCLPAATCV